MMKRRLCAVGLLALMACSFSFSAGAQTVINNKTKVVPLLFRTSTDSGDPNRQGYIDSSVTRRSAVWGTVTTQSDTTAPISTLLFTPERLGAVADSSHLFTFAIFPTANTSFTAGADSINLGIEVSANNRDWVTVAYLIPIAELGTSNTMIRRINITRVTTTIGAPHTIGFWPLVRFIVTSDLNGEFQANLTGIGP